MAKKGISSEKSLSARKAARRAAARALARATRINRNSILIIIPSSRKECINRMAVIKKRDLIPPPTPPRRKPGRGGS